MIRCVQLNEVEESRDIDRNHSYISLVKHRSAERVAMKDRNRVFRNASPFERTAAGCKETGLVEITHDPRNVNEETA